MRLYGLGWNSYSANGWNIFDILVAGGSLITTVIVRVHAGGFAVQQLQKLFLTTMAFKLVQRTNSLNKLFKTAVYVSHVRFNFIPLIISLQCEFACDFQPLGIVVDPLHVLCYSFRRSVQHDQVEYWGESEPELLHDVERPCDAGIHDNWVSLHISSQ